jgi:hypothetical protein
MSETLEAALDLARRGYRVFPVGKDKKPLAGSHGCLDATTDEQTIRGWFTNAPGRYVAVATGEKDDGERFAIIDLDLKDGKNGLAELERFEATHDALPETPRVRSQSGGKHLWFATNGVVIRNSASKVATGIDVRGEGGYVVVPGGNAYTWEVDLDSCDPPPMPDWLVKLCGEPARKSDGGPSGEDGIPEGRRNAILTSLAGTMRRRGMTEDAIFAALSAENRARCRPPLAESEVRNIAASVARYPPGRDDTGPTDGNGSGRPHQTQAGGAGRDYRPTSRSIEPLDIIGAPELVGFPTLTAECLPAPLFRYVQSEALRLNTDTCPIAAHVLAACATSIHGSWRIKPKRHDWWTEPAILWTCVVKDVGMRGTETIRSAFWPVRGCDRKNYHEWKSLHAGWKKRQAEKGKDDPDDDNPEPIYRRLISNDATVEAVSELLKTGDDYATLTLECDELVVFLGGFTRYSTTGSSARADWLQAYDGGPHHIDRVRRGHVYVPNWAVTIAGNIQPRRLQGLAADLICDGLFQRFMVIHTPPQKLGVDDDQPLDPNTRDDYGQLLAAIGALRPPNAVGTSNIPPVWVDDDGRAERKQFMRLIERLQADPTLPTIIRETAPKWSGLLSRLSLIFHAVHLAERVRKGEPVEARDLSRVTGPIVIMAATFLRRIILPNLFRLGFETMPEEGEPSAHARWLAGHILAHRLECITARDIGRVYRHLRGKRAETDAAMSVLVDTGWAVPFETSRADSLSWRINPAVHEHFSAAAAMERDRRDRVREIIRQKVG